MIFFSYLKLRQSSTVTMFFVVSLQISITEDGAAANFTRSFAIKSGYYLCYSKVTHTHNQFNNHLHYCYTSVWFCCLVLHKWAVSFSLGLDWRQCGVRHSDYFRQRRSSSWLPLHSRAPWTKCAPTHILIFLTVFACGFFFCCFFAVWLMDSFCTCVCVYVCLCLEATVSKKKRVCVRLSPVSSVDTAVLDIKLTAKSKMMLQHYTYVGLVFSTIHVYGFLS